MKVFVKNYMYHLSVALFALALLCLLLIILIFLNHNEISNDQNQLIGSENDPISYVEPLSSPISTKVYKKIENYVSGGSSFYCPNNWKVCEKIQRYYSNISDKSFEEAYKYGGGIRSFDNLVNTYKDYLIVSAMYIKEEPNGIFTTYVTLVPQNKEIEYYKVAIKADENSIQSSTPTRIDNNFSLDCNYIDISENELCAFLTKDNEFANIFANGFFYKPLFTRGMNLNDNEIIFYSRGADALDHWVIIYKYNTQTKAIHFIDSIAYKSFPDFNQICTGDLNQDLGVGGCAEKYITSEEIAKNRKYINIVETYNIKFR